MRFTTWLLVAGCGMLSSGCEILGQVAENALLGPRHCWNEHQETQLYRSLATQAWEGRERCGLGTASSIFGEGYMDGYVDYLKYGGTGEPPALPPAHLRPVRNRLMEGQLAAQEWFDGFRRGASDARASGLRESIVLRSSVAAIPIEPVPISEPITVEGLVRAPIAPSVLPQFAPPLPVPATSNPPLLPMPRPQPKTESPNEPRPTPLPDAVPKDSGVGSTPAPGLRLTPNSTWIVPTPTPLIVNDDEPAVVEQRLKAPVIPRAITPQAEVPLPPNVVPRIGRPAGMQLPESEPLDP